MSEPDRPELAGWRRPAVPPGLAAKVLRAAHAAAARPRRQPVADRLWHCRTLRLGWLAAVALLLAVNLLVMIRPPDGEARVAPAVRHRSASQDPTLDRLLERQPQSAIRLADSRQVQARLLAAVGGITPPTPRQGDPT